MRWNILPLVVLTILFLILGYQVSCITKGQNQTILLVEVLIGISISVVSTFIPTTSSSSLTTPTEASVDQLCSLMKQRATADAIQAVHTALGVKL